VDCVGVVSSLCDLAVVELDCGPLDGGPVLWLVGWGHVFLGLASADSFGFDFAR